MMERLFPRTGTQKYAFFMSYIFLITFILSLVLSALSYIHLGPINRDGALYIQTAQEFLERGFIASKEMYIWPYFSILIAYVSKLFHLPLLTTVYLLHSLFIACACSMFVAVIKAIGANPKTLVMAAITILGYWFFNSSRNDVLRDSGYWFFYLSALYFILQASQKPSWSAALGWNISILCAVLFRPESIVFLAVPVVLFFHQQWSCKEKIVNSLKINLLVIGVIIATISFLLFSIKEPSYLLKLINTAIAQFKYVFTPIFDKFIATKQLLADQLLNSYSSRHAFGALVAIILALVFITLFNVIGIIYIALIIYGLYYKVFPKNNSAKHILIFALIINMAMLITFVGGNYFLSKRYAAPAALIALTIIPYALVKLSSYRKTFIMVIAVIIISTLTTVIHLKSAKNDIITAGQWIEANSTKETRIVTNDRRIALYADRKMQDILEDEDDNFVDKLVKNQHDYQIIALRFGKKEQKLEQQVLTHFKTPDKIIENKQERVLIYIKSKKISK